MPDMLQALGREMARVRLIGTWKGTLPVVMRHRQSIPVPVKVLRALQQSEVGEVPLALLFVTKFMQGLKLEIIVALQGVLIWAHAGMIKTAATASKAVIRRGKGFGSSMWGGFVRFKNWILCVEVSCKMSRSILFFFFLFFGCGLERRE